MTSTCRCAFNVHKISCIHQTHSYSSFPHLQDLSKEVTIIINEEIPDLTATYHVPERFLTEKSEFFQAACRNEGKEAKSRLIKLPDVEPEIFNSYLFWVYRDTLLIRNEWAFGEGDWEDVAHAVQSSLVKLWILADRLADARLRNALMDEMVTATGRLELASEFVLFPPEVTVLAWSATTASRSLRQLILDYYVFYVLAKDVEKDVDEHHPEFVKELMLASLRMVDERCANWQVPVDKNGCHYHEHEEKAPGRRCSQDE
jgi:hypothetical protein